MTASTPNPLRPTLTTDPTLAPFLQPTFSPIDYLNSTLPLWTPTSTTSAASVQPSLHTPTSSLSSTTPASAPSSSQTSQQQIKTTSLPTLTTETQSLLTSLDAKLTRLTSTLTQLTDDILRSGSRLSYEIEILRADAGTLDEALRGRSSASFSRFVEPQTSEDDAADANTLGTTDGAQGGARAVEMKVAARPQALETLHTLTLLRQRLQTVIKTFDLALAWPLPPSALSSVPSGLMSVTAPSARNGIGASGSEQDPEAKGQAFETRVREEVQELLEDGEEGVRLAREKVEEMRGLCVVWKGTVEERARMRLVEGLVRMVDDFEDGGG